MPIVGPGMTNAICSVCSNPTKLLCTATILTKYQVNYFKCTICEFIQTEEPYWLIEAYAEAINKSDTGLVGRNLMLARVTRAIISTLFDPASKFIDYGGGFGLFVRLMRDAGFNFYRYDKYCENIFAKDLDAELDGQQQYELLTAFELFEHLTNPFEEIKRMLSFSKSILFTTELIPGNMPLPDEWWYFGLEHGQHVSFYSLKSLIMLADRLGLVLYSDSKSLHLLTQRKIPIFLFKIITNSKMVQIINRVGRRSPLIP